MKASQTSRNSPLKTCDLVTTAAPVAMNPGMPLSGFSMGASLLPTAHSRSMCVIPAMPPKLSLKVAFSTLLGSGRPCASCNRNTPPCNQVAQVHEVHSAGYEIGLRQLLALTGLCKTMQHHTTFCEATSQVAEQSPAPATRRPDQVQRTGHW